MKKNIIIKITISWLLVFIWMIFIFYMSNMNSEKSSNVSTGLIEKTVVTSYEIGTKIGITTMPSDNEIDNIVSFVHIPVRKIAHFSEYLILGLLICNALVVSKVNKKVLLISVMMCFIYSCSDELHQMFISGRAGRIYDILIDTSGSFVGSIIFLKSRK